MFDPEEPGGLWDGELKARHLVEFPPDSVDKCARVHGGSSLWKSCCQLPFLVVPRLKARHTPPAVSLARAQNEPEFRRFTQVSNESPTNNRVPPRNIRNNLVNLGW